LRIEIILHALEDFVTFLFRSGEHVPEGVKP